MHLKSLRPCGAVVASAAAAIALALPLAAYATASSSGVATAKAEIAKYSGLSTTFTAPGPSIHAAKLLRGKTVWYVPVFLESGYFETEEAALADALKPLGAKLQVCDAKASPTTASACITQAVSSNAAGIVTSAVPVDFAQQAYTDAVDHKIPVVAAQNTSAPPNTAGFRRYFVGTSLNEALLGRLIADEVIVNSNGHANVLFADDTSDALTAEMGSGIVSAIAARCPDCKVAQMTFQDYDLENVAAQVQTAIDQHPGVNYVVTQYDDPSGPVVAEGAAQANPSVKFVASGGTPASLKNVAQGTMLANSGIDPVSNAWNLTDALLRIIADKPSVASHYVVYHRLFTKSNTTPIAGQLNNSADWVSGRWYSNGAFKAGYLKLWGVK